MRHRIYLSNIYREAMRCIASDLNFAVYFVIIAPLFYYTRGVHIFDGGSHSRAVPTDVGVNRFKGANREIWGEM